MASPISGFQEQLGTKFDVFENGARHASKRGGKTRHIAVPARPGRIGGPAEASSLSDEGLASSGPVR